MEVEDQREFVDAAWGHGAGHCVASYGRVRPTRNIPLAVTAPVGAVDKAR